MSQALTLKIYQNGQLVETKTLSQDVIKIGKLKSSHLCLEDDSVARMHAVIEVSGSDVRVIDLGSSTGTILNGRRVEKNDVLKSGDVLEFGPFHIEVEFSDEAVEHLAEIGFDPEFGARPLRRAIQRELENEVSRLLLSGALQPDDRVRVDYDDVQLTFDIDKGAAEETEEVEEPQSQPAHV